MGTEKFPRGWGHIVMPENALTKGSPFGGSHPSDQAVGEAIGEGPLQSQGEGKLTFFTSVMM